MIKICSICGTGKSHDDFYKYKATGNPHPYCKVCENAKHKEYCSKPEVKEKRMARNLISGQIYRKNNKDKIREYREANKEAIINNRKKYKERYPERLKEGKSKYYHANQEKIIEAGRLYYQKNKERIKEYNRKKKVEKRDLYNAYERNRRKENLQARIKNNCRSRISIAIRKSKKPGYKSRSTNKLIGCSYSFLASYLESKFLPGMSWENYGPKGWHIDHIIPCVAFDLSDPEQQLKCFHYTNLQPLWAYDNLSKSCRVVSMHSEQLSIAA